MSETYAALVSEEERLLSEYLRKIEHCVGLLTPAEVWWRPNARCNSVGNLLLHLSGNLSQWVLAGLGGAEYERRRREEFAAAEGGDAAALVARLHDVVTACQAVAARLSDDDLTRVHTIQGITRTGAGVLLHAVEHMAYHTGQIVFVAKQLAGERAQIEFYPHLR
jgi:uncharacterized damage-inducible protein DinB